MTVIIIAIGAGICALLFSAYLARGVIVQDTGTDRMREIAAAIQEGASAFLYREYLYIAVFVTVVTIALAILVDADAFDKFNPAAGELTSLPRTAIAYVIGALASASAGYIGMMIAVRANVRTAASAREGLNPALRVAFSSGAVMGITATGLSLICLTVLYLVFETVQPLTGFAFGASSIALFARVGGGIFTKAADVGADLVGKVEAGIPEDDPRNPATIADNVGDNVGDVAGMGADLFESYVGSIIASMAIGAILLLGLDDADKDALGKFGGMALVFLPIGIAAIGTLASIFGTFFAFWRRTGSPATRIGRTATCASM